jgi:hypothetical protein
VARGVLLLLLACGAALAESVTDFGRFQVILDRKPFGSRAESASVPIAAGPQAGSLRISAIVEGADGVRVGLIDLQGNGSLFLRVGETENGVYVVSADPVKEEAVVRRGAESITLRLEGGASRTQEPAAAPTPARIAVAAASADREVLLKQRRELALARIQARREAAMKAQGDAGSNLIQKITGPELERKLQEYQMEVIRRGDPPLPIPLTREMDDQLVTEGVLQPQ